MILDLPFLDASTHLLLAVSGGIDSVVLCHLVHASGCRFEIAHCNFHLRGADSDRDERFVRQLAERYGVPCHVAQFDTRGYAAEQGLSIEMAARRLRYRFFAQVLEKTGAVQQSVVVTAHHRDDNVETFFLNLLRGTGIAGLAGMRAVSEMTDTDPAIRVVHPLLPFSREEIEQYAAEHGLEHVEDITNSSLEYRRNRIRHQLMPLLREMVPTADKAIEQTMRHLADTEVIYRQAIEATRDRMVRHLPDGDVMDIEQLRSLHPLRSWLFELLRPYGFNAAQVADIETALDGQSGRTFYSATHRLVRERTALVISPSQETESEDNFNFQFSIFNSKDFLQRYGTFRTSPDQALFDADRLHQPLHVRFWRNGDHFQPFGMKGTRLVSDFLSDLKLAMHERETQRLLCDADDTILWVVGRRADGRYAVTPDTQRVLLVTLFSCSA